VVGIVAHLAPRYHRSRTPVRATRNVDADDERERELITIYDCGAAQKPLSAQLLGNLVRIDASHDLESAPTGYTASLREEAVLERQDQDHWVIRARARPEGPK